MTTLHDLVVQAECPVERVLSTLYDLLRTDTARHSSAILTPGCTVDELGQAEWRLGISLPPLHRLILSLSNGGSFPYVSSIQFVAAALPREQTWMWLQAPPREVNAAFDEDAGAGPFVPVVLGMSLLDVGYTAQQVEELQLDEFVVIASGYDGVFFGYRRSAIGAVEYVTTDSEHGQAWPSFHDFVLEQRLERVASTSQFIERVRTQCGT